MRGRDYEEAGSYTLDKDVLERLLREQNELNFMWTTQDHWAVGVFMSYVWRDGSFWVTSTTQRPRMRAIARDPRVSVAVSGLGTSLGSARTATAKGRVKIHDDADTKAWFYPEVAKRIIPGLPPVQRGFASLLDSERRVVIEIVPEKWITYDAAKMMADTAPAMAERSLPASWVRQIERFGGDPARVAQTLVAMLGLDDPGGAMGPRQRARALLRRLVPGRAASRS